MKKLIRRMVEISERIFYSILISNKGCFIMQEDWDNLIILDACRYDMFKEHNDIKGQLEYRLSRGSATTEFLVENFKGKKYLDTVYITANPLVSHTVPESFAKIVSVWADGWHEEYGTVLPEIMYEQTLRVNEMYPHKRLIIHFVQPHYPFIGEKSRKKIGPHEGMVGIDLFRGDGQAGHKKATAWNLLEAGKLDLDVVWECYEENLQIVMEFARRLTDQLPGKTIISSDHGNLFGERIPPFYLVKRYGHPNYRRTNSLIKVPWLIVNKGKRKQIDESEECQEVESPGDVGEEVIKSKLEALGYFE